MPVVPLPLVPTARPSPAAVLGLAGAVLAAATVPVVALMHLLPPWTRVDPVRRTISEYALGPGGWLFDAVVVGLAAASVAVLVALVGTGLARWRSAPAVLVGVWTVGMLLVVVFEKTNWAIGPSVSGYVHRYASLAAFLALPVAALLLARRARTRWPDGARRAARWATACAAVALASFVPIAVAIVAQGWTGVPWFRAVPLGLIERTLALAEVGVVVALGVAASTPLRTDGSRRRPGRSARTIGAPSGPPA